MQAITHFLVGIVLQILIFPERPPFETPVLNLIVGIVLIFFSHFLIDCIAKLTYHPPRAKTDDKFWIIFHILIFIGSGMVLVYFWIPYWIGMGFSVLVDLYDWVFIRGIRYLKKDPIWAERYQIHPIIDKIRDKLFFWLPNWNEKRYGVIPEIILIGILLYFYIYLT
ncbi:MAG: hypothetical protein ACTSO9_10680 [Candidatus Helarchaeota archaeon]